MSEPIQHPDDRGEWARGRHIVEPVTRNRVAVRSATGERRRPQLNPAKAQPAPADTIRVRADDTPRGRKLQRTYVDKPRFIVAVRSIVRDARAALAVSDGLERDILATVLHQLDILGLSLEQQADLS